MVRERAALCEVKIIGKLREKNKKTTVPPFLKKRSRCERKDAALRVHGASKGAVLGRGVGEKIEFFGQARRR